MCLHRHATALWSARAMRSVCLLCCPEIAHSAFVCVFPLGVFLPPAVRRSAAALFSGPALEATSFIEKCLFHFRTDRQSRGGSDIRRKSAQTMYSPLTMQSPPAPYRPLPHSFCLFFFHQRDTRADDISISGFGIS